MSSVHARSAVPAMPALHILSGDQAGATIPLDGFAGRMVLGRGGNADVVLADAKASREHVAIARVDGVWRLEDLASRNGTLLNGVKLTEAVTLKAGDRIRFGLTEIEFTSGATARGTRLRRVEGTQIGRDHPIAGERCAIGRVVAGRAGAGQTGPGVDDPAGSIGIDDEGASREHAAVTLEDGVWRLRDLGSRNGTFLNGERIARATRLKTGDRIRIGLTVLQFFDGRCDDLAGATIGDCLLEARIGAGSLGVVYRARRVAHPIGEAAATCAELSASGPGAASESGAPCAVKLLDPGRATDPGEIARFANAWQHRCDDDRVVRLLAVVPGPSPAMIMEWLPRGSLAERLAGGQAIPAGQALAIVRDVAQGLAGAARRRSHHRGLRPGNILFSADGSALVGDLALCAPFDSTRPEESPDTHYLAPEEVGGAAPDERSNQFSLGLILYQAITGRLPFAGRDRAGLARARLEGGLPAPGDLDDQVPEAVDNLLARMLARHPADRYADWDAVIADLDRVMAGGVLAAPPPGLSVLIALGADGGDEAGISTESAHVPVRARGRWSDVARETGVPPSAWLGLGIVAAMVVIAVMIGSTSAPQEPPRATAGDDGGWVVRPVDPLPATPAPPRPASVVPMPGLDDDRLALAPHGQLPPVAARPQGSAPASVGLAPAAPLPAASLPSVTRVDAPVAPATSAEPAIAQEDAPPSLAAPSLAVAPSLSAALPTATAPVPPPHAHPLLIYCRAGVWERGAITTAAGERLTGDFTLVEGGVAVKPAARTLSWSEVKEVEFAKPTSASEGDALVDHRRYADAAAAYARALERNPGHPYLAARRAAAQHDADAVAMAAAAVPKAILAGEHREVLDHLAIYIALVRPQRLEPAWRTAFEQAWTSAMAGASADERARWLAAAKAMKLKLKADPPRP